MKHIYTIDLSLDKSRENRYLSETLLTKIEEWLKRWEKSILYLNKRGQFSSYICSDCSYIFSCPNCDLSLNIHSSPDRLMCHHCFYEEKLTNQCKECHGVALERVWVGTAQIESSIKKLFPTASVYRFDTDNLKTITAKKEALQTLESTDIIIGTKMITTGFNIKKLGLIWVILVEQELNIPRYNNEENVYSNIRQLLWRGGRVWQKTEILLQTYAVKNPLIQNITQKNYRDFFIENLKERQIFWYPPYAELVYISYKHKEKKKSLEYIKKISQEFLRVAQTEIQVIMVDTPIKRNNQYFSKIILKGNNIRNFLEPWRKEILRNSDLSVSFET